MSKKPSKVGMLVLRLLGYKEMPPPPPSDQGGYQHRSLVPGRERDGGDPFDRPGGSTVTGGPERELSVTAPATEAWCLGICPAFIADQVRGGSPNLRRMAA